MWDWLTDLGKAFSFREAEWWVPYFTGGAAVASAIALVCLYSPRGRSQRLPGLNRDMADRRGLRNPPSTDAGGGRIVAVCISASSDRTGLARDDHNVRPAADGDFDARCSANARKPSLMQANRCRTPDCGGPRRRLPARRGRLVEPEASYLAAVLDACMEVLRDHAAGRPLPVRTGPIDPLPIWVEESIELTIVRGLGAAPQMPVDWSRRPLPASRARLERGTSLVRGGVGRPGSYRRAQGGRIRRPPDVEREDRALHGTGILRRTSSVGRPALEGGAYHSGSGIARDRSTDGLRLEYHVPPDDRSMRSISIDEVVPGLPTDQPLGVFAEPDGDFRASLPQRFQSAWGDVVPGSDHAE